MTTKRQLFHDYYALSKAGGLHVFDGQGPERDRYRFRGDAMEHSIVVRIDINCYARWALNQPVISRVELADDFLSKLIAALDRYGGILYSDDPEGAYAIFGDYFSPRTGLEEAIEFSAEILQEGLSVRPLDLRAVISAGPLVFFQRPHEVASCDWSADGAPIRRACWLSQTVHEKRCMYLSADDFELVGKQARDRLFRRSGWTRRCSKVVLPQQARPERMVEIVAFDCKPRPAEDALTDVTTTGHQGDTK